MSEDTSRLKGHTQTDLLEKAIARMEVEDPDSPILEHMRTQMNYMRRAQRQFAGLEREWPNPCM